MPCPRWARNTRTDSPRDSTSSPTIHFPSTRARSIAALVRLEQKGWIKGAWQTYDTNRAAKYYAITRTGVRALNQQTERWQRLSGLVNKLPQSS